MTIKHTPGPWKYNANTRQIGVVDTSNTQSYGMMMVVAYIDECDHSEYAANALLIAAAPDLLKALSMCLASMKSCIPDFNPHDQAAYDHAIAAIAKATGAAE